MSANNAITDIVKSPISEENLFESIVEESVEESSDDFQTQLEVDEFRSELLKGSERSMDLTTWTFDKSPVTTESQTGDTTGLTQTADGQPESDFETSFLKSLLEPLDLSSINDNTIVDSVFKTLTDQGLGAQEAMAHTLNITLHLNNDSLHVIESLKLADDITAQTDLNGDTVMKEVVDDLYSLSDTPQHSRHLSEVMTMTANASETSSGALKLGPGLSPDDPKTLLEKWKSMPSSAETAETGASEMELGQGLTLKNPKTLTEGVKSISSDVAETGLGPNPTEAELDAFVEDLVAETEAELVATGEMSVIEAEAERYALSALRRSLAAEVIEGFALGPVAVEALALSAVGAAVYEGYQAIRHHHANAAVEPLANAVQEKLDTANNIIIKAGLANRVPTPTEMNQINEVMSSIRGDISDLKKAIESHPYASDDLKNRAGAANILADSLYEAALKSPLGLDLAPLDGGESRSQLFESSLQQSIMSDDQLRNALLSGEKGFDINYQLTSDSLGQFGTQFVIDVADGTTLTTEQINQLTQYTHNAVSGEGAATTTDVQGIAIGEPELLINTHSGKLIGCRSFLSQT